MAGSQEMLKAIIAESLALFGTREDIGRRTPDLTLEAIARQRNPTLRARAKILSHLLDQAKIDSEPGLELGSGDGELLRLLTQEGLDTNICFSDIDLTRLQRSLPDNAETLELDVTNINLPVCSQNWVIAANLLDQFTDPTDPLAEILRVLKPGGSLICYQDLQPDEFVFFQRHPDRFLIPLASSQNARTVLPYFALSQGQAERFKQLQPPNTADFWGAYMQLPSLDRAIACRLTHHPYFFFIFHNFMLLYETGQLGFEPEVIDLVAESHRIIALAIEALGYEDIQPNLIQKTVIDLPTEYQVSGHEYHYAFGGLDVVNNPVLVRMGKVEENAIVGTITALKPN
jgi:SAM-dependent methyltransferase